MFSCVQLKCPSMEQKTGWIFLDLTFPIIKYKLWLYRILFLKKKMLSGIPPGSVNGLTFFFFFINDISQHVHIGITNLYADECFMYWTGHNMSDANYMVQPCISMVAEWYEANSLIVNSSVTPFHKELIWLSETTAPYFVLFLFCPILFHPVFPVLGSISVADLTFHLMSWKSP